MLAIQASFLVHISPAGTEFKVAVFSLACTSLQHSRHLLAKLLFVLSPTQRKLRSSDYWATVGVLAPPRSTEQLRATNESPAMSWLVSKSGLHVEVPQRPSRAARRPSGAARPSVSGDERPAGWEASAARNRRASAAGDPGSSRLGMLQQGGDRTRKRGLSNAQADTGRRSRRESNAQVGDLYTTNI